jgi:c(7)-type cytochrome triheme protein
VRSLGHTPCAGCHQQQFNDPQSPICAICHTAQGSKQLKPFPSMRTFAVRFDHASHARAATSCALCHKPAGRASVAESIPSGTGAHATCFTCHEPRATAPDGSDISSCGTCHTLGRLARTPTLAPAYRVNFSHAKHGAAQKLNCADCHTVRAGAPPSRQVSAPTPLMHHARPGAQSCLTCHNGQRAFGGDNFAVCTRCHTGPAWQF